MRPRHCLRLTTPFGPATGRGCFTDRNKNVLHFRHTLNIIFYFCSITLVRGVTLDFPFSSREIVQNYLKKPPACPRRLSTRSSQEIRSKCFWIHSGQIEINDDIISGFILREVNAKSINLFKICRQLKIGLRGRR